MSTTRPTERAAFAAFAAFAFLAALFRIGTWDVWWHLATGRWILSGHGIPRTDPFSFTAQGNEWIDHEWLFQVFVYLVHGRGGEVALTIVKAALVAATAVVAYRFVRRESPLPAAVAAPVLAIFVVAGRNRFIVRPELFTVLFAALLLAALFARRERPPELRRLLWIPALFALWANLHGGMIVGVAILGLFVAGRAIERFSGKSVDDGLPSLETAGSLLGLGLVAGLLNPFGWHVYRVPFELTALMQSGPFRNAEWTPPRFPVHGVFWTLALGSLALVVAVTARRRRVEWPALLPYLFLLAIGIRYVRNTAVFSLLVPFLLVRLLWPDGPAREEAPRRLRPFLAKTMATAATVTASVAVLGLGVALATLGFGQIPGLGVDARKIPVGAVNFLEVARLPGRILNAYDYGGYVNWRLGERVPIFIDGRNEVFVGLRRELAESVTDGRKWFALLERYAIDYTLLQYIDRLEIVYEADPDGGPPTVTRRPYAINHFPPEEWALVYWDDTAMVHVRRATAPPELVEQLAYEHVRPESVEHQVDAVRRGEVDKSEALVELSRKLEEDPSCERAMGLWAALREMR